MATLENKKIKNTYQGLLKTEDNNVLNSSLKQITDGSGVGSGVSLDNAGNVTATATITANAFVGDGSGLTNLPADAVSSVNTQTGAVVLDTDNIAEGSTNFYYTDTRVSANSAVAANTAKTGITAQQASDIQTNNAKTGITTAQADEITANTAKVGITTQQADDIVSNNAKNSYPTADATKLAGVETGAEVNVQANWNETDTNSDAFIQNKPSIPSVPVTSVNTETGDVVLDTDDISEGTSNLYYTDARVSANASVTANTAKVGITTQQANDITANNAKVGITTQQATDISTNNSKVGITTSQADAIVANTAKNTYPSSDATKLAGIEAGAEVNPTSTDELSEGSTNLYYTDTRVSANSDVTANTAKVTRRPVVAGGNTLDTSETLTFAAGSNVSINESGGTVTISSSGGGGGGGGDITEVTAGDGLTGGGTTGDVTLNVAGGTGITANANDVAIDFTDFDTDNITEGTTNLYFTDARVSANSAVASNTAKNSYPTADETKLSGIEAGAEVNPTNTDGLSEGSSNLYYTDARVSANTDVVANTAKVSFDSTSSTKLGTIETNADVTDATNVTAALVAATSISSGDKTTILSNIGAGSGAVDSVNGATGTVVLNSDDINEGSTNLYFSDARVSANSAVAANTAKTGITTTQANEITANTAKVGITTSQADAITANTAKVGITTAQANAITANTAKVGITTTQANNITTNNSKVSDTGTPAILSNGSTPSLNSGISAAEVRSLIGAGTGSGTMSFWQMAGDSGSNQTLTSTQIASFNGGTGISTATSSGDNLTINLDNTNVTAGSYTTADITVDAQGRITAAANGSAGGSNQFASGIYVGGTASANLLDDYEEGTYTPSITATGTDTSGFSSIGYYTKIGDIVHVEMRIYNFVDDDGTCTITNITLPFAANNTSTIYYKGGLWHSETYDKSNLYTLLRESTTNLTPYNGATLGLQLAADEGNTVGVNITYKIQ